MEKCIANKKLFLLDLDGTVYIGDQLIDGVPDFLDYVKKSGCKYMFLTNNSSKSIQEYMEKFAALGIAAAESDIITSAAVTSLYLHRHHKGKKIYVLGNRAFRDALTLDGHSVTDRYSEDIDVLVVGYDTELTYQKIKDACSLLRRDMPYIATNPDLICPTENGYIPECGSIVELLKNATGKQPLYIGKPEPAMIELAVAKAGVRKADTLMIGDRMYTDIAGGANAGVDTALVLSGEGTAADAEAAEKKPTFIYKSIREIYNDLVRAGKL